MTSGSRLTKSEKHSRYCAICTSCLSADDAGNCVECGSTRPPNGWPEIDVSPYPYLGKILDGRYLLNQFLGDGATGYVYRAQGLQISRFFAAKIVDTRRYGKPEFEEELLRRFNLEVDAMSRLRNPHVVNVYEAMQLHDNVFVLLMDFVDGRTLQELLDRVGRVKLQRALDIIRQVSNGLYEAHAQGFIHRDLKPDNIMIERLPASGFFAKILDFGIVHMMDSVTSTQGFRGTPLYASPEQCLGDPGIDHRSDIYSLGCVFFHCVTGEPPFPGTESLKVMDAHVNEPPPKASDVLESTKVPPRLDDLLTSMLAKKPSDRPEDLSEVIRQIDVLMNDANALREQTSPHPPLAKIALETRQDDFELNRRIETADFPAPSLGESSSSGVTQLVRPLAEYNLPEAIAREAGVFTASTLSARGDSAVVADRRHRVHLVSLKNDGVFKTFEGARGLITAVYLDSTSGSVFASELDGTILRWDINDPSKMDRVAKLSDRVYAMTCDRSARILAATERGKVVAISLNGGQQKVLITGNAPISSLVVSPNENKVFVGFWGGKLELHDMTTGRSKVLDSVPSNPISMVISDDGYIAAVLDEDFNVRILSLVHGSSFFEITADVASLKAIAFDEKSQILGMSIDKTTLQLWDVRNQPAMRHLDA